MELAGEFEKRVVGAGIFCIIVGEFSHRQWSSPVILFVIDEDSEVGLHRTILPFGLAVGLQVEGG